MCETPKGTTSGSCSATPPPSKRGFSGGGPRNRVAFGFLRFNGVQSYVSCAAGDPWQADGSPCATGVVHLPTVLNSRTVVLTTAMYCLRQVIISPHTAANRP